MAAYVTCDHCAAALEINDEHVGWRVRCPQCSAVFLARPAGVLAGGQEAPSPWSQTPPRPPSAADSPPPALSLGAPAAAPFAPTTPVRVPPAPVPQQIPPAAPLQSNPDGLFAPPVPSAPNAPVHRLAKTALVLGILSIACLHWLAGIPAVICAVKARREIRASNGALAGDHMALAALILGIIGIALSGIGDSHKGGFSFPFGHNFNVNLKK